MFKDIFLNLARTKGKFSTVSVLLLIIATILYTFVTGIFITINNNQKEFDQRVNDTASYRIVDNLTGEKEKEFFKNENAVQILKNLYKNLKENSSFDYAVYTSQPIYIPDLKLDRKFWVHYGEIPSDELQENCYDSVQVNNIGVEKSNIKIKSGRSFNENDYIYTEGKTLPLLAGNDLSDYVKIGEKFKVEYLNEFITYEVIGCLEENSYYIKDGNVVYFDKTFVLPAIDCDFDPVSHEQKSFQKKVYLQNTNGVIYSDLNAIILQSELDNICTKLGVVPYTILGMPSLTILGLETQTAVNIFFVIVIILLIISLICAALNKLSKTDFMLKSYAIHYLCGAKRSFIMVFVFLESLIWALTAFIPAILVNLLLFGSHAQYTHMAILMVLLAVIIPLPSLVKVYRMNMSYYIRRQDV